MTLKLPTGQREWVKKLAIKHVVVPHIERAIDALGDMEWDASFRAKAKDDAWHPSGDCTPSLHTLFLKGTGRLTNNRPFDSGTRKTFAIGHFWHAYLQEVMVQGGLADPANIERRGMMGWGPVAARHFDHIGDIPWEPWHWSTGSIDVADCDVPGHGKAVVDFKTMNPRLFASNNPPAYYADKWECQLNVYMDWTGVDTAFIIAIDKGTGEMKEWMYERNQDLIDAIYLKWQIAGECITEDIEPPEDEDVELPLAGPRPAK